MQPNDLPLARLPAGPRDEAHAQVLEFLLAFTEAFEQRPAQSSTRPPRTDLPS